MPKIRKQPKRSTKKQVLPSLRNPFLSDPPILPSLITENLKHLDHIIPRHIDELICEPSDSISMNLDLMKEALLQQELKISQLKGLTTKKKISAETCELEGGQHEEPEYISSNQLLECPVQLNDVDWILYSNEPIDFF